MKRYYFDYAATTPMRKEVLKAMQPFWQKQFGNPSSLYLEGRIAKQTIESARAKVANILRTQPKEIIFTNGGTESVNLALQGTAHFYRQQFSHPKIIISSIEHPAGLETAKALREEGFETAYLKVQKNGLVDLEQLKQLIDEQTILVSIMYANNEIGVIEPLPKIAQIIKDFRQKHQTTFPFFHTDACQAAGYLDIQPNKLGVDLMSLNGGKIYGPKATGILYKREGVEIKPIIHGGGQEKNYRSGTENVPGIIGFATALELAQKEKEKESQRLKSLRDYLIKNVLKTIPKVFVNGDLKNRLPNNAHFTILDVEGEALILKLDECGIAASTGSACHSKSLQPSHVLQAIGLPNEFIHGSLRITLGKDTTKKDINYLTQALKKVVQELRELSPISLKLKS
ncbi:MAG TPA: cysteine desulfurase family protein [Candidatus Paceibacterota bacterium]|nr:cysteine desulfurase family protein [Candidatus Paceibacterota bacterium]